MFSKFHKLFDCLSSLERQIFQGATLIFAISLILNGANVFYKTTVIAPIEGGSFTEGLIGQPIAINPLISANNDVDRDIMELVFSDLSEFIDSYKVADNKKTWNIELKKNLFWSDGKPLTADDVIFTLDAIQSPETRSPLVVTWQSVAAEKLNDQEIRFTLKTPYAFFLENLKSLKIIPQHVFGSIPLTNLRLSDYNLEPVSSGPYAFADYKKRKDGFITQYSFSANKFYAGEKPLIREFNFVFFEDYAGAVNAFNKKEIDGLGGLTPEDLSGIKIGHQVKEINIPRYYAVFFNQSTAPALKNKEVRRALEFATDRNKIIDSALNKRAMPIWGPIYPEMEGYNQDLKDDFGYSLENAKKNLDDAKWLIDEDGVRFKQSGKEKIRLEFQMVVPQIGFLLEAAKILSASWAEIGVKLSPIILSPSEVASEPIKTRNYQMILFGNILKNSPDVFSFWHSSERFYPGLNLALYENKTVDELLEAIRKNSDSSSRIRDIKKIQTLIKSDLPAIFLFSPSYLYISPRGLGGFTSKIINSPANRFDDVGKWFLKTARVFK